MEGVELMMDTQPMDLYWLLELYNNKGFLILVLYFLYRLRTTY